MSDPAAAPDDLDALPFDELRSRAFHRAERHLDVGFFWDLVKHLPSAGDLSGDDGSAGAAGAGITEVVELVRELFGRDLGESRPLLRAHFIDYLRRNGE